MSIATSVGGVRAVGVAAVASLALTIACGASAPATSNKPCSSSSSDRWSAQIIQAKTAPYNVSPTYDVPKNLTNCSIGFINPGKSIPFFETWSVAMNDAAKFYGVTFSEDDVALKYENEATSFQTMEVKNLAAVGAHPGNPALLAATKAANVPLITIDATVEGNPYSIGVPNDQVGTTSGSKAAAAAKEKLSGAWSGKSVVYIGLSAGGCAACDTRVQSGLAAVKSVLTIDDSNVVISEKAGGDPTVSAAVVNDVLTAHPNSVFVIVGLNDETVVGALHALDAAHRLGHAVTVSLGADKLGREALRNPTYANTLLGAVDFNPYAEAWDLIAAEIAIARGETFKPYSVSTFLTASTVNTYYPLPDNRV